MEKERKKGNKKIKEIKTRWKATEMQRGILRKQIYLSREICP